MSTKRQIYKIVFVVIESTQSHPNFDSGKYGAVFIDRSLRETNWLKISRAEQVLVIKIGKEKGALDRTKPSKNVKARQI